MANYSGRRQAFIIPYRGQSWRPTSVQGVQKPRPASTAKAKIEEGRKEMAEGAKASNALSKAAQMLEYAGLSKEVIATKLALGAADNFIKSLANNSRKLLPYYYQNSSLDIDNTKCYIIRFNVGRNSTKSVKSAESIHGVVNLQLSNSLSECQDLVSRKLLNRSFGFNQKSLDFLSAKFYTVVDDYSSIYQIKNYRLPIYGTRIPYGLVKQEFSNVRIRNSNTYHKLKFKIHIINIMDDDLSIYSIYEKVVNKTSSTQDFGALPIVYQISNQEPSNDYMRSVLCHYGVSLNKSSNFISQASIVKTFTRILNPGDTLDFRMIHHMGPGIRIDVAQTYLNAGAKGAQPSGYGIIIEAEGTLCQGMRLKDKAIFQGSCPGYYNYEYSKGITLVRHSGSEYYVKYYDRQYLSTPPITFAADIIGRPDEEGKEFTILSTSKQHVVFGGNISDAIENSSKPPKPPIEEIDNVFDTFNQKETFMDDINENDNDEEDFNYGDE